MSLVTFLSRMLPKDPPPAAPEKPLYPCPVRGCDAPVRIIAQDERVTTVVCDVYDCYTTYDTKPRVAQTQQIIRVQDGWHQHGTRGKQK